MHTQASTPNTSGHRDVGLIWSRVAAFASAVDSSVDRWLTDSYRIGLTDYRALTLLSGASEKELRVSALAQRIGLNSSSTTRLVSRLEAKGLARRDVCEEDGRGVYAVIDEPGEALLREVRGPYEARIADLLTRPAGHFADLDVGAVGRALKEVGAIVGS